MPIYEYRCLQCGRSLDVSHPIGAEPGPCPWCRGTVRRIYSSIGVIFKGSGFYSTDHRKTPKDEGVPKEARGDSSSTPGKGTAKEPPEGTAKEPPEGTAKEPPQGSTNEPPKGSTPDAKPS